MLWVKHIGLQQKHDETCLQHVMLASKASFGMTRSRLHLGHAVLSECMSCQVQRKHHIGPSGPIRRRRKDP